MGRAKAKCAEQFLATPIIRYVGAALQVAKAPLSTMGNQKVVQIQLCLDSTRKRWNVGMRKIKQ